MQGTRPTITLSPETLAVRDRYHAALKERQRLDRLAARTPARRRSTSFQALYASALAEIALSQNLLRERVLAEATEIDGRQHQ